MNSYSFVNKPHNQPSNPSSILQRLQQLKQSMRPSQPLDLQYSSVQANSNPSAQQGSAVQNQRLFQYLPQQTTEKTQNKPVEEGMEEYESYRKSLEKKLNYLFDKEKQIMKTQQSAVYQPLNDRQIDAFQGYRLKEDQQDGYTDELERKYNMLRDRRSSQVGLANDNQANRAIDRRVTEQQSEYQRRHKAHSTIQSNHLYGPQLIIGRKDQQIDQMQRKIRMLEMKYLGSYYQENVSPNAFEAKKDNIKSQNNVVERKGNRSKSSKEKQRNERGSPDKLKNKCPTMQKQTIDSKNQPTDKQITQSMSPHRQNHSKVTTTKPTSSPISKPNPKHPIKSYMNTIEQNRSTTQQNEQDPKQSQSLLHKQFHELKKQFQSLLEINKSMIEKVEMSEEERINKRENKQRAKAMLKEILFRLEEIKWEVRQKNGSRSLKTMGKFIGAERIKSKSQFQSTENKKKHHKNLVSMDIDMKATQNVFKSEQNQKDVYDLIKKPSNNKINSQIVTHQVQEVDKLKKLLQLQVQHRHIVEKKLQVVYGKALPLIVE